MGMKVRLAPASSFSRYNANTESAYWTIWSLNEKSASVGGRFSYSVARFNWHLQIPHGSSELTRRGRLLHVWLESTRITDGCFARWVARAHAAQVPVRQAVVMAIKRGRRQSGWIRRAKL